MSFLWSSTAYACGAFFCSSVQLPVDQTGEGVVFAIDEQASTIEMHAKISYVGPAEQFAWFVPSPAPPQLAISSEALFRGLDLATRPIFTTSPRDVPTGDTFTPTDDSDVPEDDGVTLVAAEELGPYDTVTLTADSVASLTAWLVAHDYYVPEAASAAIAPYVAEGSYIVALRLQKDRDVGDLAPIALTWPGTDPTIPLRLTSLAAVDDMPVAVWVLGAHRAVPLNYLHVVVNPFAIDWWSLGSNYPDVVRRAADEAGGQAFATDATADPAGIAARVGPPSRYHPEELAAAPTLRAFWRVLWDSRFAVTPRMLAVLERELPGATEVFNGIQDRSIWLRNPDEGCTSPGDLGCAPIDAAAAAAAFDDEIADPMRLAAAMLARYPMVTRLTSSLSPAEMTLDPMFALNPDLPPVDAVRLAQVRGDGDGDDWRTFQVPGFDPLPVPQSWVLEEQRTTLFDYLQSLAPKAALRVEQLGRTGPPVAIVDEEPALRDAIATLRVEAGLAPDEAPATGTCGCRSGSPPGGLAALLIAALLSRRRRV